MQDRQLGTHVSPDIGGVEPDVRPLTLDRTIEEGLYALVDLAAEPRDLAPVLADLSARAGAPKPSA